MVGAIFTNNCKSQAILTFYKLAEPKAPLFDVCSAVPAYFEGVLGWRIADINHVLYLQVCVS
jgi:hypothetical protein